MLFGVLVASNVVVSKRRLFTERKTTLTTMTQPETNRETFGLGFL